MKKKNRGEIVIFLFMERDPSLERRKRVNGHVVIWISCDLEWKSLGGIERIVECE